MRDAAQHVAAQELAVDVERASRASRSCRCGPLSQLQEREPAALQLRSIAGPAVGRNREKGPPTELAMTYRNCVHEPNGSPTQRHTRAQQESYEGLSANANDGTTHLFGSLGRLGTRPDVKERNFLLRFAGGCIVRPIFPTLA